MTSVFRYFQGSSGEAVDRVGRRVTNKEPKKRVCSFYPAGSEKNPSQISSFVSHNR